MKMTGEEAHRLVMELLPKDRLVYLPESFANKIAKTILSACTAESEASAAELAAVTKEREKSVEFARNDEAAKWSPIVDALQQTAEKLAAQLASVTKERDGAGARYVDLLDAEHRLSDAYIRLRMMLGAMNPPSAEVSEIWKHTESKAEQLIAAIAEVAKDREQVAVAAVERAMEHGLYYEDEICSCGWVPDENGRGDVAKLLEQWKDHIRSLGPALAIDEIRREERLEEAEWWAPMVDDCYGPPGISKTAQRLASLRAKPKGGEFGPTLAIDEIRREVLKEVGGAEHVEALHELYGLLSMQGPIDIFTVKEILVKIQVTDTRPPIDIQRIKNAMKEVDRG